MKIRAAICIVGLAGAALTGGSRGWGQAGSPAQSPTPQSGSHSQQSQASQAQRLDTPAAQSAAAPDSSAGEAPIDTPRAQQAADTSATESPVLRIPKGTRIRVGTTIRLVMTGPVSSGAQHNGDSFQALLKEPIRTSTGTLAAGTPITGTVVSAAPAGEIQSGGVLSLELTSVGGTPVISDVLSFTGAAGSRDIADAAPARGSQAIVATGARLTFTVTEQGRAPGLVPGVPPAPATANGSSGPNRNASRARRNPSASPDKASETTPETAPGVNQRPVGGATQGVVPQASQPN